MTDVNHVIRQVQRQLDEAGIESPKAEASMIVAHILDVERGKLGVMQALGHPLELSVIERINALTTARAARTPLQHLTGVTGFYGLDLKVEPGVFIPRVETEILVETTLQHIGDSVGPLKILDLCTGTGAMAVALAERLAQRHIATSLWAVDLNPAAVEIAKHNAANYNVTVLCADATDIDAILAADPKLAVSRGAFDIVVTNPPYIPTDTPVTQIEAGYDPQLALYGGSSDGTDIPLAIAEQALEWLRAGGFFMMEHDHSHAAALATALQQHAGWQQVMTVKDLTGTNRFITAIRSEMVQPTQETASALAQ